MEVTTGARRDAMCALCISELYSAPSHFLIIRPTPEDYRMTDYPSKIISAVLAGTHTVELGMNGQQLTFLAVTVYQGTDLCATHVTKMTMMGTPPYYPREYTSR